MKIPLFPLDLILFPGEEIELHIFEERYKALFAVLQKNNGVCGIVKKPKGKIFGVVGTTFTLVEVINTYKSGELDVLIRGHELFDLKVFEEFPSDSIYPQGEVSLLETDVFGSVPSDLLSLANETLRVATGNENRPWSGLILMTDLLQVLQLPLELKEQFLSSLKTNQWKSFLAGQMRLFISIHRQMRELRGNIQLN